MLVKALGPIRPSPRENERLHHEYEILRALDLDVLVRPLAVSTHDGMPALVVEDFGGVELDRVVERPMDPGAFIRLALQIVSAVAKIHQRGLIHADLTPQSILLNPITGELKVAELEFARPAPYAPLASGTVEGTLAYMSPERTGRTHRSVDQRSDLYSLGVLFYELLSGRLPFLAHDPIEWIHCHFARTPPPLSEVAADIPEPLAAIVHTLLAKMPEDRYQGIEGLEADLQRCLASWETTGTIAPFELRQRDFSTTLRIPQRLYGRQAELARLWHAFERMVDTGAAGVALVSGYSGIGKSVLVHELAVPMMGARGLFAVGKFEQLPTHTPYATVVGALRDLVLTVLTEPEDKVVAWRRQMAAALGRNGRIITDVIHEVELLIGEQPAVPELSANETQHRFLHVVQRFVSVFATRDHPVVLFLDDLQWADAASLTLVQHLLTSAEARYLLVIGGFRSNEVGAGHPLSRTIAELRARGITPTDVEVGPLSVAHLEQLVADTVHRSDDDVRALAQLIEIKTRGNPLFAIQFLTALRQERLIEIDQTSGRSRWDLEKIRDRGFTDNIVDLMVEKLNQLPEVTRSILTRAAFIGSTVDRRTLGVIAERSEPEIARELATAIASGLIQSSSDQVAFMHDRVQQAACSLVPTSRRPGLHLHIGRLLYAATAPEQLDDHLFDIVGHLNLGQALIADPDERLAIARLDLAAGRKAKTKAAYAAAVSYLRAGNALLPDDGWERHYPLAYELHLEAARCEFFTGEFRAADRLCVVLHDHVDNPVEAAEIYRVEVEARMMEGRIPQAIEAALEGLGKLGIALSAHPTFDQVEAAYHRVTALLGDRKIEDIIDLPAMTRPETKAAMSILSTMAGPAYFTDNNLLYLHGLYMVELSLAQGNAASSGQGYSLLGFVLVAVFDRYADAYRYGKLALELAERQNLVGARAKARLTLETLSFWSRPLDEMEGHLRTAFDEAVEIGDQTLACFCCSHLIADLLERGDPLEHVYRESEPCLEFVRRANFHDAYDLILGMQRFVAVMRGDTVDFQSFTGPGFDEVAFEATLTPQRTSTMVCWYYIIKLQARLLSGDLEAALVASSQAKELLWSSLGHVQFHDYHVYRALALTGNYERADPAELQSRLRRWASHHPGNFAHTCQLVSAEILRIAGQDMEAIRCYEQAIRMARAGGFVQIEGLAYELASEFWRKHGFEVVADTFVREARACFHRWGGEGKVKQLERRYPRSVDHPGRTFAPPEIALDLLSVVKASQTISSELTIENLATTLLRLVVEHGGARKGYLILVTAGALTLEAEAISDQRVEARLLPSLPVAASKLVPISIVNYVWRTREPAVLDHAVEWAERFGADPYFAYVRPLSILCLPIIRQGEPIGLLYLENDLVEAAFRPTEVAVVELLASQAAISLETARSLVRERAARAKAEAAERRAAFLAEATGVLTESLEYESIPSRLAGLAVRFLAVWCVIDMLDDSQLVRIAATHRDPAKQPLLDELKRQFPPGPDSRHPATAVLKTRNPLVLDELPDTELAKYTENAEHAMLIRALGAVSVMVVPLIAQGQVVGAITLASSDHRYGQAELALTQELAHTAAIAITNARLYREAREAVRVRDDFLAVASHELYTPITSLMLSLDAMVEPDRPRPVDPLTLRRLIELSRRQGVRLTRLVSDLLDVSRIGRRQLQLSIEDVDLGGLVRDIVVRNETDLSRAGCEVTISETSAARGRWDRSRIDQVITNVLSNALKFGAGRPITIQIARRGDLAVLTVRDGGIGMDRAARGRIFGRFARAVSSEHYGGLGLGLYICRSIVEAHGGTIRVDSELGAGSTFTVELPLSPTASGTLDQSNER